MKSRDDSSDFLDPRLIFRLAEEGKGDVWPEPDDDVSATAEFPKITRMPEGIEVVEERVGKAVGQWVLHVRCQCGRRWFELEAIDATHCPRCGRYVYLDVQTDSPGG